MEFHIENLVTGMDFTPQFRNSLIDQVADAIQEDSEFMDEIRKVCKEEGITDVARMVYEMALKAVERYKAQTVFDLEINL